MPPPFGLDPSQLGAGPLGAGADPVSSAALQALDEIRPKSPNPTAAIQRIDQALDLVHKLIMAIIPQVQQWSPKAVKDLHQMGRMAQTVKSELRKEVTPGPPPELFVGAGAAGPPGASPMGGGTPY